MATASLLFPMVCIALSAIFTMTFYRHALAKLLQKCARLTRRGWRRLKHQFQDFGRYTARIINRLGNRVDGTYDRLHSSDTPEDDLELADLEAAFDVYFSEDSSPTLSEDSVADDDENKDWNPAESLYEDSPSSSGSSSPPGLFDTPPNGSPYYIPLITTPSDRERYPDWVDRLVEIWVKQAGIAAEMDRNSSARD